MENRSSDNTDRPLTGYTGHIQTDDTGLICMTRARPVPTPFGRQWPCSPFRPHRQSWRWVRGRYYSPSWHRFVNSDQGVDPSSWNQFAYVDGRSFLATDPSGRVAEAPSWGGGFRTVVVWGEASDVEFMDVWDWFQQEALQLFPELDHDRVGSTGDFSRDGRGGGGGGGSKPQTKGDPCAKLKAAGVTKEDWSRMVDAYNSMIKNNSNPNVPMREYGFARQGASYYDLQPKWDSYRRNNAGRGFYPYSTIDVIPNGGAGINFHTHFDPGPSRYSFGGLNSVSRNDRAMAASYGSANMMFLVGSATSLYQFDKKGNSYQIAGSGWWNLNCF